MCIIQFCNSIIPLQRFQYCSLLFEYSLAFPWFSGLPMHFEVALSSWQRQPGIARVMCSFCSFGFYSMYFFSQRFSTWGPISKTCARKGRSFPKDLAELSAIGWEKVRYFCGFPSLPLKGLVCFKIFWGNLKLEPPCFLVFLWLPRAKWFGGIFYERWNRQVKSQITLKITFLHPKFSPLIIVNINWVIPIL